jgi:hypothetical protein
MIIFPALLILVIQHSSLEDVEYFLAMKNLYPFNSHHCILLSTPLMAIIIIVIRENAIIDTTHHEI